MCLQTAVSQCSYHEMSKVISLMLKCQEMLKWIIRSQVTVEGLMPQAQRSRFLYKTYYFKTVVLIVIFVVRKILNCYYCWKIKT